MLKIPYIFLAGALLLCGCATDLMTGKSTMAFIPNNQIISSASTQYAQVLNKSKVVKGTPEAEMLSKVGWKLVKAAEKWVAAKGSPNHFKDYKWAFTLIEDKNINAWAMPGGQIAFYTGILGVTQNEAGIAVVMGHEIAHAILNHGQQRMSAGLLQQAGMAGASLALSGTGMSKTAQDLSMTAFGVGSNVFGTLPFSRKHEDEADLLGLILMAVAGYDPNEAPKFWERMNALSGGSSSGPAWLSTHPSHKDRIKNLKDSIPKAQQTAAGFGV
ncbi:MAG: M48 family metallopeptidase [Alphaproteobacteria bacterium]|nr:M48 family metallopeptidase [Alphaproteobacteria bacterium]